MTVDRLEALFENFITKASIFQNREILGHDFIPEELPHREEEIIKLGAILAPSLKGAKCSNIFIYGKTGTGKTAATKHVLTKLLKMVGIFTKPIRICYVNCKLSGTQYRIVSQMCQTVGLKIPSTGLATAEIFTRFKEGLEKSASIFIGVFDEVDELVKKYGDQLLYEFTRANEELVNSRVTVIGISNDLYFKDALDPRVLSSLGEEELVFKPYSAEELRDILLQRARKAFNPGVIPESSINLCAALAAAEHGDARRALDLIRIAGEVAERSGSRVVTEDHIRQAQRRIDQDRVMEVIASLPIQAKIILHALCQARKGGRSNVTTGELYEHYHRLCQWRGLEALTYRRVSGLLNELNTLGVISAPIANLGRYGRTKHIRLNLSDRIIQTFFSEDDQAGVPCLHRGNGLEAC
ncbi:MAG: orc1/cdc6 family replication initiation protein [Candidatus Bathyarchaeia archaeon]